MYEYTQTQTSTFLYICILKPWDHTENSHYNAIRLFILAFSLSIIVTSFSKKRKLIPIFLNRITYLISPPVCDQSPIIIATPSSIQLTSLQIHFNLTIWILCRAVIVPHVVSSLIYLTPCTEPTILCGLQSYYNKLMSPHWVTLLGRCSAHSTLALRLYNGHSSIGIPLSPRSGSKHPSHPSYIDVLLTLLPCLPLHHCNLPSNQVLAPNNITVNHLEDLGLNCSGRKKRKRKKLKGMRQIGREREQERKRNALIFYFKIIKLILNQHSTYASITTFLHITIIILHYGRRFSEEKYRPFWKLLNFLNPLNTTPTVPHINTSLFPIGTIHIKVETSTKFTKSLATAAMCWVLDCLSPSLSFKIVMRKWKSYKIATQKNMINKSKHTDTKRHLKKS